VDKSIEDDLLTQSQFARRWGLFGVGVVASYPVLVELGNSDSSKDADDCNYDQQFYEGEA